ncbi:universal stress protein [Polynucleobacter sp. AP-Sanab-80-C2]|uniref:universal stress protein n=1 Tax=Polynucleobacter sp. AP-Sanab-80-C2 TaxID=3108274 RepID=UPI002B231C1B|nr:universal stress protein [Polynucleobacter sp. AP-Sanab-80-C2]MEA9599152.1 universal stress protein [Polynucleobacter sp. AP-Sanab-80-C2]
MKILVAVDGSSNSLRAVKFAVNLVKDLRSKSSITLINVHDDDPLGMVKRYVGSQVVKDYLIEMSQKELKSALKILDKSQVKHSGIIELGHVPTMICNIAKAEKSDMIIMGAKGRSSVSDIVLGSVSQRVSVLAKQAVLLVK